MGTLIIGIIVLGIAALAGRKVYKDQKKGNTCSCGCENCPGKS